MDVYWIWLSKIKGIGPIMGKKLLEKFIEPENVYKATYEELLALDGIGEKIAKTIVDSKAETMYKAEIILKECKRNSISILTMNNELYPSEVKILRDSPLILYYSGNIKKNPIGVGIVGSRRCTDYGKRIASEAAKHLAVNNIPVISGMAKGIDGYAHTACVNAGGYTIAFLGCGVDISYPKEHLGLMEKIKETGAVISEYPPKTKPDALNFPKRNRLISAFSKKLLVVEASESSGSLITAEFAKNYGRKVFSAPNSIFSNESKGSNKLIFNGATIYISPEQLLDELISIGNKNKEYDDPIQINTYNKIDNIEKIILNAINKEPKNIDELKKTVNNGSIDLLEKLSLMELDGKIKILRGRIFGVRN